MTEERIECIRIVQRVDGKGWDAIIRPEDSSQVKNVLPFSSFEEAKEWAEKRAEQLIRRGE